MSERSVRGGGESDRRMRCGQQKLSAYLWILLTICHHHCTAADGAAELAASAAAVSGNYELRESNYVVTAAKTSALKTNKILPTAIRRPGGGGGNNNDRNRALAEHDIDAEAEEEEGDGGDTFDGGGGGGAEEEEEAEEKDRFSQFATFSFRPGLMIDHRRLFPAPADRAPGSTAVRVRPPPVMEPTTEDEIDDERIFYDIVDSKHLISRLGSGSSASSGHGLMMELGMHRGTQTATAAAKAGKGWRGATAPARLCLSLCVWWRGRTGTGMAPVELEWNGFK